MPTFLSDPPTSLYTILGAMVIVLGAIAFRRRKKHDLISFVIGADLLLAVFLIDKVMESPREVSQRQIQEMAAASQAKQYDDLFKYVSESFQYKSLTKKGMREKAKLAETYMPDGFETWQIKRSNFKEIDDNTIEQGFLAQPKNSGNPAFQFYFIATFKKEGDAWRMTDLKIYDPLKRDTGPEVQIPGLQ